MRLCRCCICNHCFYEVLLFYCQIKSKSKIALKLSTTVENVIEEITCVSLMQKTLHQSGQKSVSREMEHVSTLS